MEDFNKVRLTLKSLMSGQPVEIGGQVFRMAEDYDIVQEMESYTVADGVKSEPTKKYVGTHMSVKDFAQMCQQLSKSDTLIMAANLALNR